MGLWASPDTRTLWLSSKYQLWKFRQTGTEAVPHQPAVGTPVDGDGNIPPAWTAKGCDAAYLPRVGYTTGDQDVHDFAVDLNGRVVFVSTLFGRLATINDDASFTPLWKPPFFSGLVPEDRCHLNGLAMKDGQPGFVTVGSQSDVADGWRDRRQDGGCVLSVPGGDIVCNGQGDAAFATLVSPRWYRHAGIATLVSRSAVAAEFGLRRIRLRRRRDGKARNSTIYSQFDTTDPLSDVDAATHTQPTTLPGCGTRHAAAFSDRLVGRRNSLRKNRLAECLVMVIKGPTSG